MTPLLQAVLGVLAAYHVLVGALSLVSFGATSRVVAGLYGVRLETQQQLRHAVRMLGLTSLALGALMALAARDPGGHREVIMVVTGLQLARATARVVWHRDLAEAFGVSVARNAAAIVLLIAESAALAIGVASLSDG